MVPGVVSTVPPKMPPLLVRLAPTPSVTPTPPVPFAKPPAPPVPPEMTALFTTVPMAATETPAPPVPPVPLSDPPACPPLMVPILASETLAPDVNAAAAEARRACAGAAEAAGAPQDCARVAEGGEQEHAVPARTALASNADPAAMAAIDEVVVDQLGAGLGVNADTAGAPGDRVITEGIIAPDDKNIGQRGAAVQHGAGAAGAARVHEVGRVAADDIVGIDHRTFFQQHAGAAVAGPNGGGVTVAAVATVDDAVVQDGAGGGHDDAGAAAAVMRAAVARAGIVAAVAAVDLVEIGQGDRAEDLDAIEAVAADVVVPVVAVDRAEVEDSVAGGGGARVQRRITIECWAEVAAAGDGERAAVPGGAEKHFGGDRRADR